MEHPEENITRPKSLQLLCILTFIGSGLSAFSYLIFSVALDTVKDVVQINDLTFLNSADDKRMIAMILSLPRYYFVLHFVLYIASVFGAVLMWNMRKTGFHLYAIAQIILLIIYRIFLPNAQFPVFPLIVTIFFILLYASHVRYMK